MLGGSFRVEALVAGDLIVKEAVKGLSEPLHNINCDKTLMQYL